MESLIINGVKYVPETVMAEHNGLPYCIIRCLGAGVHAGYLKSKTETEVVLLDSRRLWRWWGKTLSGLATEGTFAPEKCKFADTVPEITLSGWCEIIPCTETARKSLEGVAKWTND
jgi:hypothetical protein